MWEPEVRMIRRIRCERPLEQWKTREGSFALIIRSGRNVRDAGEDFPEIGGIPAGGALFERITDLPGGDL